MVRWLAWSAEYIRYTVAPLNELVYAAKHTAEFDALPFLCAETRTAMCEQIQKHRMAMALTEEDARLLYECVEGFGEADLEGEIRRLRHYGSLFERRYREAQEEAIRRGRVCVTLGVCGGGAVALLLGG